MDTIKIGKFIASLRKRKNLTQMELADKLNITDRAISKWECGKALPDASIMLDLCQILEISVNELLTGEELEMKDYNKQAELNLINMVNEKKQADKRLLQMEVVIGFVSVVFLLLTVIIGAYLMQKDESNLWIFITLISIGIIQFIVSLCFALKIEQVAGYYECKHCHHKYVPTYKQVNLAMHMGRTRYMKCPNCGKKSWQKKVIDKE